MPAELDPTVEQLLDDARKRLNLPSNTPSEEVYEALDRHYAKQKPMIAHPQNKHYGVGASGPARLPDKRAELPEKPVDIEAAYKQALKNTES